MSAGGDTDLDGLHTAWDQFCDELRSLGHEAMTTPPPCRYWSVHLNNWWLESPEFRDGQSVCLNDDTTCSCDIDLSCVRAKTTVASLPPDRHARAPPPLSVAASSPGNDRHTCAGCPSRSPLVADHPGDLLVRSRFVGAPQSSTNRSVEVRSQE